MREHLRFSGKIMSATVSRVADKWFVSIAVETDPPIKPLGINIVGVDLGISSLATLSTGEVITGTKPYKHLLQRVKRLSRSLSRKTNGSKSRDKAKRKLAQLHHRIKNIRQDGLHKLTTRLAESHQTVCIEDLNVKGLMKNKRLAQSVADMGFYEFRRQLTYKMAMRGGKLIVADCWFASTQICSCCSTKNGKLPLSVRQWQCSYCGAQHNRDVNAACNLRDYALKQVSTP